jgi:hypothetical protein
VQAGVGGGGPTEDRFRASIGVFVTLFGVALGLTLLYLGMRAVMDIGGACAGGNTPFVPSRPCPGGVPGLMLAGVWGGIIFAGLYAWQSFRHGVPNLVGLLWPALFLSLGWNFLEYGLDPPGDGGGLAWGWLISAVVFGLMGGLPLLAALPATARAFTGRSVPGPQGPLSGLGTFRSMGPALRMARRAATVARPEEGGLVSALERLDALHRSGALDDEEYERAKDRLLAEERAE